MGLLTLESVNELEAVHGDVAEGLDEFERGIQTLHKLVKESWMLPDFFTKAENTVRDHSVQQELLQQKIQDVAALQEQRQKKIQEETELKQQIATLQEQIQKKDEEIASLKDLTKRISAAMKSVAPDPTMAARLPPSE